MNRLTVVTPTLNQGRYIESTLLSVLRQLGPDDSYVVVDGGSTDRTHEILDRYDDHLTAVYVKPGLSQAQALAFGFQRFPGEFAAYLNSDDIWLPGTVERALTLLAHRPTLRFVYGDRVFIDGEGTVTGVWRLPRHSTYLMLRWDYIPQESSFWRYEAMMATGGIDSTLQFAVDYDLFIRLMRTGPVRHVPEVLSAFREHSRSKTSTQNESTGKSEVAILKQRYGIRAHPWDRPLGALLRSVVAWRSARYLRGRRQETLQQAVDAAVRQTVGPLADQDE